MYVFVHTNKTVVVKLDALFPECSILLSNFPHLFNLNCLVSKSMCPANARCMEKLVPRINFLFDCFKEAEMLIAYFKFKNDIRLRAGIFFREDKYPKVIRIGPNGWDKFKKGLEMYEVTLPSSLTQLVEKSNDAQEQLISISPINKEMEPEVNANKPNSE